MRHELGSGSARPALFVQQRETVGNPVAKTPALSLTWRIAEGEASPFQVRGSGCLVLWAPGTLDPGQIVCLSKGVKALGRLG